MHSFVRFPIAVFRYTIRKVDLTDTANFLGSDLAGKCRVASDSSEARVDLISINDLDQ